MHDATEARPRSARGAAIYANTYRTWNPRAAATGFRTSGLRHRSLSHSDAPRVAEEFLLNTRYLRHDRETEVSIQSYFMDPGVEMLSLLGREQEGAAPRRDLPDGARLRRELGEAIGRRRSRRTYTGDPIALSYLATLLRAAGAVTGEAHVDLMGGGEARLRFRTAPSGGGLYPIDVHVAALKVSGLERGLYRYDPQGDALVQHGGGDAADRLLACFAVPEEIVTLSRACAVMLLVARPWRSMRKYGSRGVRYVFVEAGAIAQCVHLAAEALGVGTVDCASVYEDEAGDVMGIDGLFEQLVHTVVVGYSG